MDEPASQKPDTSSALEALMNRVRASKKRSPAFLRGGEHGKSQPPPVPVRRKPGAGGDRATEGGGVSREELRREREALDRRAAQLDRMEAILQRMLRSVERREDEIREREITAARVGLDDELKAELIRRERTVRETEARLDERERFLDESEALLLKKAREWVNLMTADGGNGENERGGRRFDRKAGPL